MAENDVADSTDWLSTPLAALTAVESAMRCEVCKDFYDTPMITSCSHTFCSLCIRRVLSNENKCPLCRAPEQEIKLRSNWSMEEAVEAFKKARPAALELAQNAGSRSPKRKAEDMTENEEPASGSKRLRSSARISQRGSQAPSYAPDPEEQVIQATDDDGDYTPEPNDGLVPCPSCNKRMKEWQVFTHLESCPGPTPQKKSQPPQPQTRQHNKTMERLPALSYSMLKEGALRKKLAELGISNSGPRTLLERRHREYITMWNANCDAASPKSRTDLLRQLDVWERTQGGRAPMTGRAMQNAAIIKDKDFNGSAWASQHNDLYKDLIANARKSSMAARQKAKDDGPTSEAEVAHPPQDPSPGLPDSVIPNMYDFQAEPTTETPMIRHLEAQPAASQYYTASPTVPPNGPPTETPIVRHLGAPPTPSQYYMESPGVPLNRSPMETPMMEPTPPQYYGDSPALLPNGSPTEPQDIKSPGIS